MKNALIIFVRHPEKGKVKTRIAATLGEDKALEIYIELLKHTAEISADVIADKFVFYTNEIPGDDVWSRPGFIKKLQCDHDLGMKMKSAFTEVLSQGYSKAIIIGSDCFELSAEIIEASFNMLDEKEVVIGPANDGGYYLLGMNVLHPFLFENKAWSTEQVFQQTADDLSERNISFAALDTLTDIDTAEDWKNYNQSKYVV